MNVEVFEKYRNEIKEDLNLNDLNLHDKQMRMPGIKHKWVARLIQTKFEKNKLKKERNVLMDRIVDVLREEEIVVITEKGRRSAAENHKSIRELDEQIEVAELIIIYLEKVEKLISSTTWDIKNIIEIKKLELT